MPEDKFDYSPASLDLPGSEFKNVRTFFQQIKHVAADKVTRIYLAVFAMTHAYDHYGQLVEYLRMNGIVPPASRSK